jgi:hypothetical protein
VWLDKDGGAVELNVLMQQRVGVLGGLFDFGHADPLRF